MAAAQFGIPAAHQGRIIPFDNLAFSFSEDRLHASLLMSDFALELVGAEQPLSDLLVATFQIPVDLPDAAQMSAYTAVLHGFVSRTEGTRVSVWVDLGGASTGWELPYGEAFDGDFVRRVGAWETRLDRDTQPDRAPVAPYAATVVVTAQRRTTADQVQIHLDTLDITLVG